MKTPKRKTATRKTPKQTAQHHEAFCLWYEFDRDIEKTCKQLNIKPSTFYTWIQRFNWNERADELDKKAYEKAERILINDKAKRQAEMLKQHYDCGTALLAKGLTYLKEKGIENGHQAIRAVEIGVKVQRQAEGLPDYLLDLLDKTTDELRQELYDIAHGESEFTEDEEV